MSPYEGKIRLLTLNIDGRGAVVVDAFRQRIDLLVAALAETNAIVIAQNAKFDVKFLLHEFGRAPKRIFDPFRASALLHNGRDLSHDLWSIYDRELGVKPSTADLSASDWSGDLSREQMEYAADDVRHLPQLREILRRKLIAEGLVEAATIEFEVIESEAAVELQGIFLDRAAWLEEVSKHEAERNRLMSELYRDLPLPTGWMLPEWNLDSPQQMLDSLQRAGIPVADTSEMQLAIAGGPLIAKILAYREHAQCCKSFGRDYPDKWINRSTGRVHPSYYGMLKARRYSCSKPNLAQIPRGAGYRGCFQAPPGRVFVIADYSGIEMRIAADMARDERLIAIFNSDDDDIHRATAAAITRKRPEDVSKKERSDHKATNFGFIYGSGGETFSRVAKKLFGLDYTIAEAEAVRAKFFAAYPGLERWQRETLRAGKATRVVRSRSGALRHMGEDAHNEILNTPVQMTGADGLKSSLAIVHRALPKRAAIVHHVHDEIIVECDERQAADCSRILHDGMVSGMQRFIERVPVKVEPSVGRTWADK